MTQVRCLNFFATWRNLQLTVVQIIFRTPYFKHDVYFFHLETTKNIFLSARTLPFHTVEYFSPSPMDSPQSIKWVFLPLPKMKYKAPQGSSRPWADIATTMSAHHPHPQKDPNLWTKICPLGSLQIPEVWNFLASLVFLCVVCNFPSSTFRPFWDERNKRKLSRSNTVGKKIA